MNKDIFTLISFALILLLTSCTKPDPNPHLGDYIYQDLKGKLAEQETLKGNQSSAFTDLSHKLADEDSQSIQLKILRHKVNVAKWEIQKTEQKINYLKMKIFDREKFVREHYIESFKKGEKWDNASEVADYKKVEQWEKKLKNKGLPSKNDKKPAEHGGGAHGGEEHGGGGEHEGAEAPPPSGGGHGGGEE